MISLTQQKACTFEQAILLFSPNILISLLLLYCKIYFLAYELYRTFHSYLERKGWLNSCAQNPASISAMYALQVRVRSQKQSLKI